ncbi:MAG: rRNA maturation RNase YbeY [Candidatus Zixiibacteriota bacterium]
MRLNIYKQVPTIVPRKSIESLFALVCRGETKSRIGGQINLVFTGDRAIRKLNAEFRGKDKATDVLSFNVESTGEPESVFGELYISAPTAARQAREYGGTLQEEYLRLVCHGLLHVFGYDHIRKSDAVKMESREEKYLSSVSRRGR